MSGMYLLMSNFLNDFRPRALCIEMGFYVDIFWESRCNIEINVWAKFLKILLAFEAPHQPTECLEKAKITNSW